jgi:sulfite reductase (ferredoxin)
VDEIVVEETAVEAVKRESAHLRGSIAAELANAESTVSHDAEHLLKFHGIYTQDDRDVRRERTQAKQALEFIFMLRVAIPGGRLTADQWLALDTLADEVADGSIRLTTRQAVQFHGVYKHGLQPLVQTLDRNLMTSFAACGDVVRNVVACPDLTLSDPNGRLAKMVDHLAVAFRPTTEAYWELFVNGEPAVQRVAEKEKPYYGDNYLPRKFKIAVAHPHDNCVDVYAQDVGLIPTEHPELGQGFTVLVGGGLGRSYANEDTFARLADPLTFALDDELDEVIAAILQTYHDLGGRTDRRRARMKYLVADRGLEAFQQEVEARLGRSLRPIPTPWTPVAAADHLGWSKSHGDTWQLGVRIGAGRIRNHKDGPQQRSAFATLAKTFNAHFAVTAQQDLIVAGIAEADKEAVIEILRDHGVVLDDELGAVERNALACVALPTCSQALAEAERRLPELVDGLEATLSQVGIGDRRLQVRMTGCPNGCARPAVAEIGLVGRTKTGYDLFLGGGLRGDRLATLVAEKVKLEDLDQHLTPLLDQWKNEGEEGEAFGDFLHRAGLL